MTEIENNEPAAPKRTDWWMKFTDDGSAPVVKVNGREVKPVIRYSKAQPAPFTIQHFRYSDVKTFYRKVKRGPGKGRVRPFPVYGMSYVHLDTDSPSKVQFFSRTKSG